MVALWSVCLVAAACNPSDSTSLIQQAMGMGGGELPGDTGGTTDVVPPSVVLLGEITHPLMKSATRVAASPSGDIVVTDPRGALVHVFNTFGRLRFHIAGLRRPLGCVVDDERRIYVGDEDTGSVRVFDPLGAPLHSLGRGTGEFVMPSDLAFDPASDTIYVVDSKRNHVKAFDTTGASKGVFGTSGNGPGQFMFATGIAYSEAPQHLYVGDHDSGRIQVFDRSGIRLGGFGSPGTGSGQFTRLQGLVLDDLERIYAVDVFQGRLQVLDENGAHLSYLGEYGTGEGQLASPLDAALDSHNRLLVTSYRTAKVVVYGIDSYTLPASLPATVVVEPNPLSQESKGKWVTAYVEVPSRSAGEVAVDTVRLNDALAPERSDLGDEDDDGIPDLMLKFSRSDLIASLPGPGLHELIVTGELETGEHFGGTAILVVEEEVEE